MPACLCNKIPSAYKEAQLTLPHNPKYSSSCEETKKQDRSKYFTIKKTQRLNAAKKRRKKKGRHSQERNKNPLHSLSPPPPSKPSTTSDLLGNNPNSSTCSLTSSVPCSTGSPTTTPRATKPAAPASALGDEIVIELEQLLGLDADALEGAFEG